MDSRSNYSKSLYAVTMKTINTLKKAFLNRAECPNDLFLLTPADAISFINQLHENGISIAGIESFKKTKAGALQPWQDFSNDIADFPGIDQKEFISRTIDLIKKSTEYEFIFQIVMQKQS